MKQTIILFFTLLCLKTQGQNNILLKKCPEYHTHDGKFFIQSDTTNQRVYFDEEYFAKAFIFLMQNDIFSIPMFFKLNGLEIYNDDSNYCRDFKINYRGIGILVTSILIEPSKIRKVSNENIVIHTSFQQKWEFGNLYTS